MLPANTPSSYLQDEVIQFVREGGGTLQVLPREVVPSHDPGEDREVSAPEEEHPVVRQLDCPDDLIAEIGKFVEY